MNVNLFKKRNWSIEKCLKGMSPYSNSPMAIAMIFMGKFIMSLKVCPSPSGYKDFPSG